MILFPLLPAGSTLFSTSPGLLAATHQQLMMQQQTLLLQQLRQQQQHHYIIQGASLSSPPQSSVSLAGNVITSRTNANPMQNSITTGGGLVMTASGHGYHQPSFHVGGSEPLLKSSSSGSNRIRAPISHIPSGNPPFQKRPLLQGKQSLNSGTSIPRQHRSSHNHNEEIT